MTQKKRNVDMIYTVIAHSIISVLSFYLFCIFAWWWWVQKRATTIYGYTCYLMFGICITNLGAAYLYWRKIQCQDEDLGLFVPDWWVYRHLFTLIPLILYSWYATKKICIIDKGIHMKRRSGDFDSDHFNPDRSKRIDDDE